MKLLVSIYVVKVADNDIEQYCPVDFEVFEVSPEI